MADVLDQSDIDALLSAVSDGEIEEESAEAQIFSRFRRDLENVEINRVREDNDQNPDSQTQSHFDAEGLVYRSGCHREGPLLYLQGIPVKQADEGIAGHFGVLNIG